MKFILESNGIISDIQDGESLEAKQKEFPTYHIMDCPDNFTGARGDELRIFDAFLARLKNSELVNKGFITLSETQKLDGETIREKTLQEKYDEKLFTPEKGYIVKDNVLQMKPELELIKLGILTKDEYNERQKQRRQAAYRETADIIFLQYQRGEATEKEWIAEIERVKKVYSYIN